MKTQIIHNPANIQRFLDWLEAKGAEMIHLTNEYEVARYRYKDQVHVVYKTKGKSYDSGREHLSFSSNHAYGHYLEALD